MTSRQVIIHNTTQKLYSDMLMNYDFYIKDTNLKLYIRKLAETYKIQSFNAKMLENAILKELYLRFLNERSLMQLQREDVTKHNEIIAYIEKFLK